MGLQLQVNPACLSSTFFEYTEEPPQEAKHLIRLLGRFWCSGSRRTTKDSGCSSQAVAPLTVIWVSSGHELLIVTSGTLILPASIFGPGY